MQTGFIGRFSIRRIARKDCGRQSFRSEPASAMNELRDQRAHYQEAVPPIGHTSNVPLGRSNVLDIGFTDLQSNSPVEQGHRECIGGARCL